MSIGGGTLGQFSPSAMLKPSKVVWMKRSQGKVTLKQRWLLSPIQSSTQLADVFQILAAFKRCCRRSVPASAAPWGSGARWLSPADCWLLLLSTPSLGGGWFPPWCPEAGVLGVQFPPKSRNIFKDIYIPEALFLFLVSFFGPPPKTWRDPKNTTQAGKQYQKYDTKTQQNNAKEANAKHVL